MIWGALHGIYLVIHRLWSGLGIHLPRAIAWPVTLLAVVIAWVYFRAADVGSAHAILAGMFGGNGFSLKTPNISDLPADGIPFIVIAGALALMAPNSIEIFGRYGATLKLVTLQKRVLGARERLLQWRPVTVGAVWIGLITTAGMVAILGWQSEFLYFQF